MKPDEMNEDELIVYKSALKEFARMAAEYPDMIDNLRANLKFSAATLITNRPNVKTDFGKAVDEMDSFLKACQTGEVDPHAVWRAMDEEESEKMEDE